MSNVDPVLRSHVRPFFISGSDGHGRVELTVIEGWWKIILLQYAASRINFHAGSRRRQTDMIIGLITHLCALQLVRTHPRLAALVIIRTLHCSPLAGFFYGGDATISTTYGVIDALAGGSRRGWTGGWCARKKVIVVCGGGSSGARETIVVRGARKKPLRIVSVALSLHFPHTAVERKAACVWVVSSAALESGQRRWPKKCTTSSWLLIYVLGQPTKQEFCSRLHTIPCATTTCA